MSAANLLLISSRLHLKNELELTMNIRMSFIFVTYFPPLFF